MRVCQPGPVARHLTITSTGRRIEISFFGLSDRGRPPLFTLPRASMSSVSSGSSSYSSGWMTCVATLPRSEPKERGDARLLAVIGFSHAEHVAIRATRCVTYDHHAIIKHAKTDHPGLAVVPADVFGLEIRSLKHNLGVFKVQLPVGKGLYPLPRIVGDDHKVIVFTSTAERKSDASLAWRGFLSHTRGSGCPRRSNTKWLRQSSCWCRCHSGSPSASVVSCKYRATQLQTIIPATPPSPRSPPWRVFPSMPPPARRSWPGSCAPSPRGRPAPAP